MPKKAIKKQKMYQTFCRDQVKKGLINQPDGTWKPFNSGFAMHRDCKEGYKL